MNFDETDLNIVNNRSDISKKDIKLLIPIKQFLYFDVTQPQEFMELENNGLLNVRGQIPVVSITTLFENLRLELLHTLNNKFQDSAFLTSSQAKIEILEELMKHRLYFEKLYETLVSLKYNYSDDYIEDGNYVIADEIAYLYNENKKFIVTKGDLNRIGVVNHGILSSCGFQDGCSLFYEKYYFTSPLIPVFQKGVVTYVNREEIENKTVYEPLFLINRDKVNQIKSEYTKGNIELTTKECLFNDLIKISEAKTTKNLYSYFQLTDRFEIKEAKIFYTGFIKATLGIEFGPGFYKWIVLNINEFNCKSYLNNIFQIIEFDKNLRDEWILDILYNKFTKHINDFIKLTGNKNGFVIKILEEFTFVFNSDKIDELIDSNELEKYTKKYNINFDNDFIETLFLFSYADNINKSQTYDDKEDNLFVKNEVNKELESLEREKYIQNSKETIHKVCQLINFLEKEYKKEISILYFLEKYISIKCNTLFSIYMGFFFDIKYKKYISTSYTNYIEFQSSLKNIKLLNEFYLQTENYINKESIPSSLIPKEIKKMKLVSNLIKNSEINSKFSNGKNILFLTEKTYLILEKDVMKIGYFDYKLNKLKSIIKIEIIDTNFLREDNEMIKNKSKMQINGKNFVKRENYKELIPYFLIIPLFIKEGLIEILITVNSIKFFYKKYVVYIELNNSGYEFLTEDNLKTYTIRISAHDSFGYVFDKQDAFEKIIIKDIPKYLKFLDLLVDSILIYSNKKILYTNEELVYTNKETVFINNIHSEDKFYEIFKSEEICSRTLLNLKSQVNEFIIFKIDFSLKEFLLDFIKTNINEDIPGDIQKALKENITTIFQHPEILKTLFNFLEEKNFFVIKISKVYFYMSPYFIGSNNLVTNCLLEDEGFNLKIFCERDIQFALNHINPLFTDTINSIGSGIINSIGLGIKDLNSKNIFKSLSTRNPEKYNIDLIFKEVEEIFLLKDSYCDEEIYMIFMLLNFGGDISLWWDMINNK